MMRRKTTEKYRGKRYSNMPLAHKPEEGKKYPDRTEAERLLAEGGKCNPGPWGDHSRTAARCAEKTARQTGLDVRDIV